VISKVETEINTGETIEITTKMGVEQVCIIEEISTNSGNPMYERTNTQYFREIRRNGEYVPPSSTPAYTIEFLTQLHQIQFNTPVLPKQTLAKQHFKKVSGKNEQVHISR
jgi:ABC-type uncharacterized transport system substrate-binding protein